MAITINSRPCQKCGKHTTNPVMCMKCYRSSAAGLLEIRMERIAAELQAPGADGGPCMRCCVHWDKRCLLGLPEGGTLAAAELCSARELDSLLE
jgi:hypothetical protein